MMKSAPRRSARPADWLAAAARPVEEARVASEERRAIELERAALEDAIRRAVERGALGVRPAYRPPRSILANPYLPAGCTILLLLLIRYLANP